MFQLQMARLQSGCSYTPGMLSYQPQRGFEVGSGSCVLNCSVFGSSKPPFCKRLPGHSFDRSTNALTNCKLINSTAMAVKLRIFLFVRILLLFQRNRPAEQVDGGAVSRKQLGAAVTPMSFPTSKNYTFVTQIYNIYICLALIKFRASVLPTFAVQQRLLDQTRRTPEAAMLIKHTRV